MTRTRAGAIVLLLTCAAAIGAPGPFVLPAVVAAGVAVWALRTARALGRVRAGRRAPSQAAIELGTDRASRRVWIADGELASHGLILGASGAGKTTTLLRILTEQVRAGQPVVAIDMKGSPAFAATLESAAAAAGRPFKRWTMDGGAHWNPLQHGNPTELKDKLISTERFSEPHYQRAAERYLQMALGVFRAAHPDRPPTLEDVVRLMDPRRLPMLLRELPRHVADPAQDYLAGLTPDQQSAIRGLQTRLALITESAAGQYLAPARPAQTIDVRSALQGEDVVLFSLNSSTYGKLASQLGTLVVQDLVSALGHQLAHRGLGRKATIAIDEFSGLGGDHVVSLFARVREAGGGVLVATQEMADLDRAASGLRDQVVGNTAFKLVHRQDVPASARMVAQMAGTERRWEEARQVGGGFFGGSWGARGTRRQVDRFILDPNEIMSLRTGEAAMISKLRGGRPRIVRVSGEASDGRRATRPDRGAQGRSGRDGPSASRPA
jgi:conjugal transfer pilus assembly protein TraD